MKKILFRADGNATIGAGHIMRCLSIGEAARELGMECMYVTADPSFEPLIRKKGFSYAVMNTRYFDMDNEWVALEGILGQYQPDVIFIDSYYVTAGYLKRLKKYGKTVYLDDMLAFAYPVDVLVNYNIYADRAEYEALYSKSRIALPALLLGTEYVPLRKEFQHPKVSDVKDDVENILISVGGADPEHMALKFLNCFVQEPEIAGKYKFHFIIGSFEPDREELRRIAAQYSWVLLHENVQCMSALMLESDLAISAAGSTLYELSTCGVPTITYVLADNQRPGALGFEANGIMVNAGDCRTKADFFQILCREIKLLSANRRKRTSMCEKGRSMVDGKGAKQIVKGVMVQIG